jgi:ribosomal protein S19
VIIVVVVVVIVDFDDVIISYVLSIRTYEFLDITYQKIEKWKTKFKTHQRREIIIKEYVINVYKYHDKGYVRIFIFT